MIFEKSAASYGAESWQRMKAVVVSRSMEGPEELKFEEFPDPVPGAGEVLVRVRHQHQSVRHHAVLEPAKDAAPIKFPRCRWSRPLQERFSKSGWEWSTRTNTSPVPELDRGTLRTSALPVLHTCEQRLLSSFANFLRRMKAALFSKIIPRTLCVVEK